MTREGIKEFAKVRLKENFWPILGASIVASIITSLSFTRVFHINGEEYRIAITFGWIFYFVTVGMTYYLIKVIKDDKPEFMDIFHFSGDFLKCLGACLLQTLFILLWTLLLIIPGIIKAFGYVLVPYLLADEKYKDMKVTEILKKSQEMMKGHKADYFVFCLSFILWWLLGIITCGIAFIYVIPYQQVATAKFLNDIKEEAEGNKTGIKKEDVKYCPQCGKEHKKTAKKCSECGTKF